MQSKQEYEVEDRTVNARYKPSKEAAPHLSL